MKSRETGEKVKVPFFSKARDREEEIAAALYGDVVSRARRPAWYQAGQVPDTVDGRFDMVALILSLLILRLEAIRTKESQRLVVRLTERFVDDMDSSLRQIGIGDMVIGKHVGRTVSALGGRLGAYREAFAKGRGLRDALQRNLYRGEGAQEALDWTAERVREESLRLGQISDRAFLTGEAA
ncbi:ubiquinol-cytochrome C chaperone family protein [Pacificimonas flava]|uniref:Ubiquinol-cytochrome C chaperone n=1 Tax=Pacificimonas flava TaxID=1234595 RepID=M2T6C4_9SPHN|nr:ubiquinol-cytochrome C chaperone family protein [Pacificimonas flava]EMD82059.1 Ubiquinol-cytochrome C chaperone [Pacificimonas flava]MBB5280899.1 cytochrome b pre-mRNA-processing protein 3 [Pacificimonas flava]